MPNKNYIAGRAKEYRVMKNLKGENRIIIRSAGSHSPVDIVCIDMAERLIRFIQCKPNNISENAKQALVGENNRLNGAFQCKFEVI